MVSKRNVLHLIDSFEQGGTERQAVQLACRMHAGGRFRVHLACFSRRGVLLPDVEKLDLGEIPEFPLTSFFDRNAVTQLGRFARLLREREIDVVQTHGFYTNVFGMAGAWRARVSNRVASKRESEGFRTPAQERAERFAFRLAQRVVANAEVVRRQLVDRGVSAAKVVTIYNGVDLERVAAKLNANQSLARLGLPRDGKRFITIVANVNHPVKDHATFLRAAQRVRAIVPDAAFIVAGEGSLLEEYRALAVRLGISDDVFFIGRCERVGDLLGISDVCVLSSQAEGFSNSILEYMAAARPVVVTDVGGAREAVVEGETGYIVPAGDDEKMAARITSLLNEPERATRMGELGRRLVEEKFSCAAQLARTEAMYEELLTRRAPAQHAVVVQGEGA
jgi:glycosyltransferase involved in cell wall biosynthesis